MTSDHMTQTEISPLAIVSPTARLGTGVRIDAFAVVEENVEIGDRVRIESHAHLRSGARISADCVVFTGASIGAVPQDLKFTGEETLACVGERTIIREYATIHRGTHATGRTVVGSDCLLMAYTHVAHDCVLGDNVILANGTQLGGHARVDDWAIIGGLVGVHQFERIGMHSMIGAGFKVSKDVPPFVTAGQWPLQFMGVNRIGLKRRGFADEDISDIVNAYRIIYTSGLNVGDALERLDREMGGSPFVRVIVDFIRGAHRGIIPGPR